MDFISLLALAVGLSMDAFAVAVTLGLAMPRFTWRKAGIVGVYFGVFQALMPVAGFFAGRLFAEVISAVDTYVVFALLVFLGGKMLVSARKDEDNAPAADLTIGVMVPFALATSIDALAVGISFAMLEINIILAVALIGTITCALSMLGVKIGAVFGSRFRVQAMVAGGLILIAIGVRVLLQGLGIF
jgi:putative Mn2+ efflux pump MntP